MQSRFPDLEHAAAVAIRHRDACARQVARALLLERAGILAAIRSSKPEHLAAAIAYRLADDLDHFEAADVTAADALRRLDEARS